MKGAQRPKLLLPTTQQPRKPRLLFARPENLELRNICDVSLSRLLHKFCVFDNIYNI
jgi:hypothetical protein